MWAKTLWPFASSTRKNALGKDSITVPSISMAPSFLATFLRTSSICTAGVDLPSWWSCGVERRPPPPHAEVGDRGRHVHRGADAVPDVVLDQAVGAGASYGGLHRGQDVGEPAVRAYGGKTVPERLVGDAQQFAHLAGHVADRDRDRRVA